MDDLLKDKKDEKEEKEEKENTLLHKTGNLGELLKAGINSSINIDMSRLSSKGFSNLLEKAKKLQDLKKSKGKNNLDLKKEEFDSIYKKGKENLKKNNISLMKIPDNFEMLKKFSQRMNNNRNTNNNIKSNDILNYTEVKSSFKNENYNGINKISNTNKKANNNFNNEKINTKGNDDVQNQENKNEKDKESIDSIKKTITNNPNIEKRKYFHFYNIFNNLSSKSNKKERFKLKLNKNKNTPILNEDNEEEKDNNIKENNCINDNIDNKNNSNNSYNEIISSSIGTERENYFTSRDNINKESENKKKISQMFKKDNNANNTSSKNSSFNLNNIYEKDDKANSMKNNDENDENGNSFNLNNIYEKQDSKKNSKEIIDENTNISINLNNIYEKQDDNNNSINLNNFYENNIYEKDLNINNNDENNNSFNLNNIYENENNDNYNNFNKNNIFEKVEKNNFNSKDLNNEYNNNDYNIPENNIINLENGEESDDDNNDIQLKAMEYETVNSNYSIKQCSTVIEYSFREDINVSYCSSMEDKSKSIENFNNKKNQMLFQLFDGYKGEEVSNFLQQNFTHIYKQYLDETKGNIPRSLVKSFKEIDEEIKKLPKFDGKSSTGTIVHIIWENRNKLMVYCGNVGNSRVSLVSPAYIIKLSQDQITPEIKNKNLHYKHKKDNNYVFKKQLEDKEGKKGKIFGNYNLKEDEEEKENENIYIKYNRFKYRKEKNEMNKIKNEGTEEDNLCCIPFISKMEIDLSIKNQFLFLASDGIWDKVDEIEMQQIIINNRDTEQLCSMLIKNALHRDTKDNMSIFSIKLT